MPFHSGARRHWPRESKSPDRTSSRQPLWRGRAARLLGQQRCEGYVVLRETHGRFCVSIAGVARKRKPRLTHGGEFVILHGPERVLPWKSRKRSLPPLAATSAHCRYRRWWTATECKRPRSRLLSRRFAGRASKRSAW